MSPLKFNLIPSHRYKNQWKRAILKKKEGRDRVKNIIRIKKKKKLYRKTRKEKCEKRNSLCDSTNFLNASRLSLGEFFPDDLYHAHPLFPCTSCQPQSRGDEKSYRCSLPNENIVVRGFSLIFSRFFFSPCSAISFVCYASYFA